MDWLIDESDPRLSGRGSDDHHRRRSLRNIVVVVVFSGSAVVGADQRYKEDGDAEEKKDGQRRGADRLKNLASLMVFGSRCRVGGVNAVVDEAPGCSSVQEKGGM